jgi:hypothetical protein
LVYDMHLWRYISWHGRVIIEEQRCVDIGLMGHCQPASQQPTDGARHGMMTIVLWKGLACGTIVIFISFITHITQQPQSAYYIGTFKTRPSYDTVVMSHQSCHVLLHLFHLLLLLYVLTCCCHGTSS